jgi:hypothetical protein
MNIPIVACFVLKNCCCKLMLKFRRVVAVIEPNHYSSVGSSSFLVYDPYTVLVFVFRKCTICWEDVQTDKPVEQCNTCHQIYHESCITRWLNTRRTQQQETNCPCCRGDMSKCVWYNIPQFSVKVFFLSMASEQPARSTVCNHWNHF